jgi:RHS repeat-associated protein
LTSIIGIAGSVGIIAVNDAGATYFVLKDHLGSTRVVLNISSTAISWYDYTPYGDIWRSNVSGEDVAYKFTVQEFDPELGLYNFRARIYDGTLGIFYASDPGHQGFSPYMYVGGNPVMRTDPTGRVFGIDDIIMGAIYLYEAYTAAHMVYNTYEAIKSGNINNIVPTLMNDAFTIASMGAGGSGPNGFGLSDWAENAGYSGFESMAGYYVGGGKSLLGGLGSFAEGAGFATLSMGLEYYEVSNWQPPAFQDGAAQPLPGYNMQQTTLTLGTASVDQGELEDAYILYRINDPASGFTVPGYTPWFHDCSKGYCYAVDIPHAEVDNLFDTYPHMAYNSEQWQGVIWKYANDEGTVKWHIGVTHSGDFWDVCPGMKYRFMRLEAYKKHMLDNYTIFKGFPVFISPGN